MNPRFLSLPVWANIAITIVVAALLFLFYFFQKKLTKTSEEEQPKFKLVCIYLLDLILFIGGVVGLLFLWEFDFSLITTDLWGDVEAFFVQQLGAIVGSIAILFVGMLINKLSKLAFDRVGLKPGPMQKRKRTIAKVTRSIIKYLVAVVAILVILSLWGVNVVPALAGLGIMGLVIGLGAQKFINDLIAGIFIIFEQHFDVGDIIEVAGFKGEVTSIGLKTTKIRNWKGEVKILANGSITNISNFSRNPSVAVVDFGIAYHEDADKTIALLNAELPKIRPQFPDIIEDPVCLGVIDLAASSVNLRVIAKTLTEKHYAIERNLRRIIKNILNEHDIEIPFPQVVVHQSDTK